MTDATTTEEQQLRWLNGLTEHTAVVALLRVCDSRSWAEQVALRRPYASVRRLQAVADEVWMGLEPDDWLEALAAHPRIGEAGGASSAWSAREQSALGTAADDVRAAIARGNRAYEERFGHVFLIAAQGRSAEEILANLRDRLGNDPAAEVRVAAEEHRRITRQRIERLMQGMSAITTHVLDTARGCSAAGMRITLEVRSGTVWTSLGAGVTDSDGRLGDLVPTGALRAGLYRLTFHTGEWFAAEGVESLYPEVSVVCDLRDHSGHYHLPLLLSPFGYSTYRGS